MRTRIFQLTKEKVLKQLTSTIYDNKSKSFLDGKTLEPLNAKKLENIVLVKTYQRKLARNRQFSRKITYFLKMPQEFLSLLPVAMVEYLGKDLDESSKF